MSSFVEGLLSGVELLISFRPTGNLIAEVVRVEGFGSLFAIASWIVVCIGVFISMERQGVFARNPRSRGLAIALMVLLILPFSGIIPVLLYGIYLLGSTAGFIMGVFAGIQLRTSKAFLVGLVFGFAGYVAMVTLLPREVAATVAGIALLVFGWQTFGEVAKAYDGHPMMYVARAFLLAGVAFLLLLNPETFAYAVMHASKSTSLPLASMPTGFLTVLYWAPSGGWVVGFFFPQSFRHL